MRVPFLPLVVPIAVAFAISGCSDAEKPVGKDENPVPDRPAAITATPTPTSAATLSWPMDAYQIPTAQRSQLAQARDSLIRTCMGRFGVQYRPSPSAPAKPEDRSRVYQIFDDRVAATHGYHAVEGEADQGKKAGLEQQRRNPLTPDQHLVLNGAEKGVDPLAATAPPERRVNGQAVPVGGCWGEAERKVMGARAGEEELDLPDLIRLGAYQRSLTDDGVTKVFALWSQCMKQQGYNYSTPTHSPDDKRWASSKTPTSVEIATARADVACKRKHNVVGVWHSVVVAYETAGADKHAQALRKFRADNDAIMVRVANVLNGGG